MSYRDVEKRLTQLEAQYQAAAPGVLANERARQAAILVSNFSWSSYFQSAQAHLASVFGEIGNGGWHPYFKGHTECILKTTDAQLAGRVRPELATAADRLRRPGPTIALAEVVDVTCWIVAVGFAYAEEHPEREVLLDALVDWMYGREWEIARVYPDWLPVGGFDALVDSWFAHGSASDGIQDP